MSKSPYFLLLVGESVLLVFSNILNNNLFSFYIMPNLLNFEKQIKHLRDMKKTNTYKYFLAVIVLSLGLLQCTTKDKQLNEKLSEMAENLNQSTPTVLDPHTRFDSVAVTSDNIFQYYYTITDIDNPHELLQQHKKDILHNMSEAFATDKSLRIFTENNVTLQYIYRDTAHKIIDVITIDPNTYKQTPIK